MRLPLDASGAPQAASAQWTLKSAVAGGLPLWLVLDYPIAGDVAAGRPDGASVLDAVGLDPPPKSATAAIVLQAEGREFARRPWRLYAQRRAATLAAAPAERRPVAFIGVVPFAPRSEDGGVDAGLTTLLAAIGDGRIREVAVRTEGDDGAVLNQATFAVGASPTHDADLLARALADARAKAATPGGCAPPSPAGAARS